MSNVISLSEYRQRHRGQFLRKHKLRLERFISRFVQTHIDVDFQEIARGYQAACALSEAAWDYVQFREVLSEALEESIGNSLVQALQREHWFDPRLITKDEIIERTLSIYIMGHGAHAQIKIQ